MSKLKPHIILFVIAAYSFILCCLSIHGGHSWGDDFILYIQQAQRFYSGEAGLYIHNKYAMDHCDEMIGPYLYPAGFPFLLSIVYKVFGLNFIAMKLLCVLFFTATLFLLYRLFKDKLSSGGLWLVIMATAFHPELITFSDLILSDFPFMFFSTLCIFMLERMKNNWFNQLLISAALIFTMLLREAGILLMAVAAAYQLTFILNNQYPNRTSFVKAIRRNSPFILPYLLTACFLLLKTIFYAESSANHSQQIAKNSLEGLYENALRYKELIMSLLPIECSRIISYLFLFLLIIACILYAKKYIIYLVYISITLILYISWPFWQGMRFIYPIVPFLLFFFVKLFDSLKNRKLFYGFFVLYTSIILIQGTRITWKYHAADIYNCESAEAKSLYSFIRANTKQADEICFFKPRALYFFTGRTSYFISNEQGLLGSKAAYLLEFQLPARSNRQFCEIYSSENFRLYKIRR